MKTIIFLILFPILLYPQEEFQSKGIQDEIPKSSHIEQFLGNYSVNESCCLGKDSYSMSIEKIDIERNTIQLKGIFYFTIDLTATVFDDQIIIEPQVVDEVIYSGKGTFYNNTLTIHLKLIDTVLGMSDKCIISGASNDVERV